MKLRSNSNMSDGIADAQIDWLLHRVGVHNAADLGGRDVYELARQMRYVNLREGYVRRTPSPDQIAGWVEDAGLGRSPWG